MESYKYWSVREKLMEKIILYICNDLFSCIHSKSKSLCKLDESVDSGISAKFCVNIDKTKIY